MPIYEYECTDCGQIDEIVQKMSDKPLTKCRNCSGSVKKLISNSAFHLRGGGWYADSYGSKSSTGSTKPNKTSEKKETTSEKKTNSSD